MQRAQSTTPPAWRSISALAERINAGARHETFSTHSIRHLVRNAARNGLQPYIRRLGRKILVDEVGFLEWLASPEKSHINQ
ncbi:MAG: hypothetical protein IT487_01390 [Chromatiaceae bacterium]|nr:hypothetical protein [Chromatiaceae bacterium]